MTLFGRRAKVVAGPLVVRSEGDVGLRITFNVRRSADRKSNAAKVEIWNLSEDTRQALDDAAREVGKRDALQFISLDVGFEDAEKNIFTADHSWVTHRRDPPHWVTTLELLDGQKALSQRMVLSSPANTSALQAVKDIAKKMALAGKQFLKDGDVQKALEGVILGGGFAHDGTADEALQRMAAVSGVRFHIQGGDLVGEAPGTPGSDSGVVLSPDSGLIGSPERFFDPKNPKFGLIKGRCLLEGDMIPSRYFHLRTRNEQGLFKILDVAHSGDTHGSDGSWVTDFEAREVQL